jgi:hypothetical protein
MRSIPAYVCTACGRGFSSARSARRHVNNIEFGDGEVVTEESYRIGITTGTIPIPSPKSAHTRTRKRSEVDIAKEEFLRGYFRKLGEEFCELSDGQTKSFLIMMVAQHLSQSSTDQAAVDLFKNWKIRKPR